MRVLIIVLMIAASSCTSQEQRDKEQRDLCEPEFGYTDG